jgi:hypothetical protein
MTESASSAAVVAAGTSTQQQSSCSQQAADAYDSTTTVYPKHVSVIQSNPAFRQHLHDSGAPAQTADGGGGGEYAPHMYLYQQHAVAGAPIYNPWTMAMMDTAGTGWAAARHAATATHFMPTPAVADDFAAMDEQVGVRIV